MVIYSLKNPDETCQIASALAQLSQSPLKLYFYGEIGVGKSTFIRAYLQSLGIDERIKSPTFSLVEPYEKNGYPIYHIDLYRITHAQEMEDIGLMEYFSTDCICCVEWAERLADQLPQADLHFYLDFYQAGRTLRIAAESEIGDKILNKLIQIIQLRSA